jgi:predicted SAM-dependent methyltransferase
MSPKKRKSISQLFKERKLVRLNLGSRDDVFKGFLGVDIDPQTKADIIWNLEKTPWPFEDNSVDEIFSSHCVEHLESLDNFLSEIHRISKKNAKFVLVFPHYSRGDFSTQHKHMYGIRLFNDYRDKFQVKNIQFKYMRMAWSYWYLYPVYALVSIINFFANLSPKFCERVWCYWFGGFDICKITTRVRKK